MNESEVQRLQEQEYLLPYHYIPRFKPHTEEIISGIELDWAAEYLLSISLVKQYIEKLTPKSMLDIGCGDGRLINEMSTLFPEIVFHGIDYSKRAIELAITMGGNASSSFECVNLISDDIVSKKKYDLVTSIEVLEHIQPVHCSYFFERNVEMVRPGGYFLLVVPHKNKKLIKKHYQHFSSKQVLKLAKQCSRDINVIEFRYLDCVGRINRILRRIAKNRIYIVHALWKIVLKYKYSRSNENEVDCGRLLCLMKCQ